MRLATIARVQLVIIASKRKCRSERILTVSKEITAYKNVELDGGTIRIYAARGENPFMEALTKEVTISEYVAFSFFTGQIETKLTTDNIESIRQLRDACNEVIEKIEGGIDEKNNNNDN